MFSPLRCLFVVVSSVVVCRAVDVALCDRSLCDCLQPNGQIGDTVKVNDGSAIGCLCTCGRVGNMKILRMLYTFIHRLEHL